jgi:(S)-mandelate dehydrogenase
MQDTTAIARTETPPAKDFTEHPRFRKLLRRFPTAAYLRRHARRHVPRFAFEYMDGGAGSNGGIARNWAALDAVELVPRYGVMTSLPPVGIELFGKQYAAPLGIAPMGGPSIVWPGADQCLAAAAQRANVPYTLGLVGGMTIERAAEIAPDVLWFQLYRCWRNDHAIGFDLVRRAQASGVHVLVLTVDVPVRTTRSREVAAGITSPFRPDLHMLCGILTSPGYLRALCKHGQPRFGNLKAYMNATADVNAVERFVRQEMGGIQLGRDRALSGPLARAAGGEGDSASCRCGNMRRAWRGWHRGFKPWWQTGRRPARRHRRASRNKPSGRKPHHRHL